LHAKCLRRPLRLFELYRPKRVGGVHEIPAYIYFSFIFVYGRDVLHVSRDFLLSAVLVAAAVDTIGIQIFGHLSDRIGRKRMYLLGAIATGAYALLYFPLLNSGVPSLIFLGMALSLVPHSMMYGPQGALIAECFTPSLRYSGASLGYQFASIVAGRPAPLIATALLAAYGSGYPIAGYIFFCALVSIVATWFLPDYTNRDISEEHSKEAPL
jgi:MFS family permease